MFIFHVSCASNRWSLNCWQSILWIWLKRTYFANLHNSSNGPRMTLKCTQAQLTLKLDAPPFYNTLSRRSSIKCKWFCWPFGMRARCMTHMDDPNLWHSNHQKRPYWCALDMLFLCRCLCYIVSDDIAQFRVHSTGLCDIWYTEMRFTDGSAQTVFLCVQ